MRFYLTCRLLGDNPENTIQAPLQFVQGIPGTQKRIVVYTEVGVGSKDLMDKKRREICV